jgi:hypothetical protein
MRFPPVKPASLRLVSSVAIAELANREHGEPAYGSDLVDAIDRAPGELGHDHEVITIPGSALVRAPTLLEVTDERRVLELELREREPARESGS